MKIFKIKGWLYKTCTHKKQFTSKRTGPASLGTYKGITNFGSTKKDYRIF